MRPGKRKPAGGNLRVSDAISGLRALYGKRETMPSRPTGQTPRLPHNWRDRLPEPAHYYGQRVEKLGRANGQGWAQGRCPFHEDHDASLSVNLGGVRGGWRCFAGCGAGDLVSFHERLTGKPFKEAVAELVRGGA